MQGTANFGFFNALLRFTIYVYRIHDFIFVSPRVKKLHVETSVISDFMRMFSSCYSEKLSESLTEIEPVTFGSGMRCFNH